MSDEDIERVTREGIPDKDTTDVYSAAFQVGLPDPSIFARARAIAEERGIAVPDEDPTFRHWSD